MKLVLLLFLIGCYLKPKTGGLKFNNSLIPNPIEEQLPKVIIDGSKEYQRLFDNLIHDRCYACHNEMEKEAEFVDLLKNADLIGYVKEGGMPPPDDPALSEEEIQLIIDYASIVLDIAPL